MSKVYNRDVQFAGSRILAVDGAFIAPIDFGSGYSSFAIGITNGIPLVVASEDVESNLSLVRIGDRLTVDTTVGSLAWGWFSAIPTSVADAQQGIEWGNLKMIVRDETIGAESSDLTCTIRTAGETADVYVASGSSFTTKVPVFFDSWDVKTGAGAISLTTQNTELVTTAADALTLANGTTGQEKTIMMKTDGGDGTLTATSAVGWTSIVFDAVGDTVTLRYRNTVGWYIVASRGVTIS